MTQPLTAPGDDAMTPGEPHPLGITTSHRGDTIVMLLSGELDTVAAGDTIVVVEAMKMEQPLTAHKAGTVSALDARPGGPVSNGTRICLIT
jgi:acetyl-CoA/propionyl-CoA carboxylase biotin carboxyl carrier protein